MIKRTLAILLSLIIVLSASGCSNYIRKAVPIPISNAFYESYQVAVAVDFAGVKHIARTECPIGTVSDCILIYTKVISGNPVDMWSWSSSASFVGVQDLDIAVTDDGVAVITWGSERLADHESTDLCVLSENLSNIFELTPYPVISIGQAHLASKLDTIYAVFPVKEGAFSTLRYTQLTGGSLSGWVSETGTGKNNIVSDLAVSPSGYLYVTYRRKYGDDIWYFDNHGVTHRFEILSGAFAYTDPSVDVNGNPETVYMAYAQNIALSPSTKDDALILAHCPANNCTFSGTFTTELPLDTSVDWDIDGNVDIIADAGPIPFITSAVTAYYTFKASNTGLTQYDIYEGIFQIGQPHLIVNISNTSNEEDEPSIGLMFSWVPVTGWVEGADIFEFDAFPFPPFSYGALRKIHHASHPILGYPGWDMACFADWGAGIWHEDDAAHRAFVIFNTYPAMLPLIKK